METFRSIKEDLENYLELKQDLNKRADLYYHSLTRYVCSIVIPLPGKTSPTILIYMLNTS